MKLMKRTNIYQCSNYNCTFDPKTISAHSYRWWKFVAVIEGKVVFNNYRYSNTTSKHQAKVHNLMSQLGIQIDIELPLPEGIKSESLAELYLVAEEYLCDQIGENELKREERNLKARHRKAAKKLTDILENEYHFRDYDIKQARQFGHVHTVAVHQIVDSKDMRHDIENALHSFHKDGFGSVVFYV